MSNLQHERNHVLDIARLVAILAVIMLHCSAPFVSGYQLFSREYIFGNIFDSVSRLGVPIFIMISGALFLDENRELTLKKVLNKNVKNLVIITVIWAFFYSAVFNVVFPLLEGTPISIKYLISGILSGHYHMWFLYMIIGLYIISPFLKKFVRKENKGMVLFFIVISLLFQFSTPVIKMVCNFGLNISYINTWKDLFHLDFFGGYITYFLVGWL